VSKTDKFLKNVDFYHDSDGEIRFKCDKMFTWHMQRMLKKIEREAREMVLIRNSQYSKPGKRLMNSIHSDGVSKIGSRNIRGSVSAGGAKAPYARFVHDGTQEHRINAKDIATGGMLKFQWARMGRVGVDSWEPLQRVQDKWHTRADNPNTRSVGTGVFDEFGDEGTRWEIKRRRWGRGRRKARFTVLPSVWHPGYEGHPFLRNATRDVVLRDYGYNTPF